MHYFPGGPRRNSPPKRSRTLIERCTEKNITHLASHYITHLSLQHTIISPHIIRISHLLTEYPSSLLTEYYSSLVLQSSPRIFGLKTYKTSGTCFIIASSIDAVRVSLGLDLVQPTVISDWQGFLT